MCSEVDRENLIPVGSSSVPFPLNVTLHYDTPALTFAHLCTCTSERNIKPEQGRRITTRDTTRKLVEESLGVATAEN